MTFTKVLDVGDLNGDTAPLMLEKSNGERFCAPLSVAQVVYLRSRLEAICDKLPPLEQPFG